MKVTFLYSIIFCCLYHFTFGQKWSLGIENQIAFSPNGFYTGNSSKDITPVENSYSFIKGNTGSGDWLSLNMHHQLREAIFFGSKLIYFNGFRQTYHVYDKADAYQNIDGKGTGILLSPYIMLSQKLKKMTLFAEGGLLLPLLMKTNFSSIYSSKTADSTVKESSQLSYRFSFGFEQSMGVKFQFSEHWSGRCYVGFQLLNCEFKEWRLLSRRQNDVEQIESLDLYDKQINYQYNINNYSNNTAFNSNTEFSKAKDELTNSHSFSVIKIGLGFFYSF